jgi:capsular polysaccharide biosynthesis protein
MSEWGEDGEIDLFQGVLFLWRARSLIIGLTLAFVLLAFVATRFRTQSYTAATDVLVTSPGVLGQPNPTHIDALDRLARSKSVRALVDAQMTREQSLGNGAEVSSYQTSVDKSTEGETPSVSVLTLSVNASSPDLARRAADTWAETIVKEEARLTASTRAATLDFYSRQYKDATDELVTRQRALEQARQQRGRDRDAARSGAADPALAMEDAELWIARANLRRAGQRMDEARWMIAALDASVRLGPPAAPPTPSSPPTVRVVGIAAVVGFGLALFIAWVASRIRSAPRPL